MSDRFDRAFSRDYLVQWVYVAAALLTLIFAIVWWTQVYENPYNVYWGMLNNSLKTTAVTNHITEKAQGETLNQYVSLDFGTKNLAYAKTTLKDAAGTVVTDSMGDLQNDYVRYTKITQPKTAKSQNFSQVLGKWAKTAATNSSNTAASVPFFVQVMLGFEGGNLVPIANLSSADRSALIAQLHADGVFQTSFTHVTRQMVHGRPIYTYNVSVESVAYVAFEQAVATDLGIKTLQSITPNSYEGDSAVQVQFKIDAWSHQLVGIAYPGTSHSETYTGYGVQTPVSTPKTTISESKLETLISGVQ